MIDTINLDNGISIVLEQVPYVRSAAFGVYIKAGAVNEPPQLAGISHFIEHMLFKGTKNRTAKQIAQEMDDVGGHLNAYTSKEHTCYHAKILDTHLELAIDIISDMIFNSNFDTDEIKKESNVIIEEISMYEDNPEDILITNLTKQIWKNSPLSNSIIGSRETVSSFQRDDFINYLNKFYVGENTTIVLVGNFDKDKIINLITDKFSQMPKGIPSIPLTKKQIYLPSKVKTFKDIEQVHLNMCFESIDMKENRIPISILNALFGGGMSSILFQKVREERGLAYSIYSYNSSYTTNGTYNIYAGLSKSQLYNTIDIIKKEIIDLKQNKFSEEKISNAKEQLKSNSIMGLENIAQRKSSMAIKKVFLDKVETLDDIVKKIDDASKKDVDDIIDKIFDFDKLSISIVGKIDDLEI